MKFYNGHDKYKPKLSSYFQMYQTQLNRVVFCATSVLAISWKHLNYPNLPLLRSVCCVYVYFNVRIIPHHLGIPLPHEDGFSKVENFYIRSAYYSI